MLLAASVLRLSTLRRLFFTSSVVIKVPRLSLHLTRVTVDGTLHRFLGVNWMTAFKGPTPLAAPRMHLTPKMKKRKRLTSPMMIMPPSDSHGTGSIALVPFLAFRCQRGRSVLLGSISGICMVLGTSICVYHSLTACVPSYLHYLLWLCPV